jgi:hypothetical protein
MVTAHAGVLTDFKKEKSILFIVPPSFISTSSVSAGVSANAVSPVIAVTSTNPTLLSAILRVS